MTRPRVTKPKYDCNINSNGLRTDPCETQLSTAHQLELLSPINTRFFLTIRKALIQSTNLQLNP